MLKYLCPVLTLFILAGCQLGKDQTAQIAFIEEVSALYDANNKPFYHGVASGDPLTDRVVIWTRVTPEDSVSSINVEWEVSLNAQFEPRFKNGTFNTTPLRDYTVKIDVDGLRPGTQYFYRFKALASVSPVGKTKTLPEGDTDSLKFAVVSCSNWQTGYFNAYDRIAEKDVDVVLHLGDYIYEYAASDKAENRKHLPPHEIVTLRDYRTRYSQYHLDEGLRNMGQQHAIITIWDDHEVANNVYSEGAQNHQADTEGDFNARKAAAKKAYYEWIPIRESDKLYRTFTFGTIAELIMLDERLEGRTKPAEGIADPNYDHADRSMLGAEQLIWFQNKLKNATSTWKVIGNQVIFSDLNRSAVNPMSPRNMDSWDGYPAEKNKIAEFIRNSSLRNIVFLTGDTHSSWAFEVVVEPPSNKPAPRSYRPLAVEFGTTSISSTNDNESRPDDTVMVTEGLYLKSNPHLKFINRRDHGYLLLTLYPEKAKAEWYYVSTVLRPDDTENLAKTLEVDRDSNLLR